MLRSLISLKEECSHTVTSGHHKNKEPDEDDSSALPRTRGGRRRPVVVESESEESEIETESEEESDDENKKVKPKPRAARAKKADAAPKPRANRKPRASTKSLQKPRKVTGGRHGAPVPVVAEVPDPKPIEPVIPKPVPKPPEQRKRVDTQMPIIKLDEPDYTNGLRWGIGKSVSFWTVPFDTNINGETVVYTDVILTQSNPSGTLLTRRNEVVVPTDFQNFVLLNGGVSLDQCIVQYPTVENDMDDSPFWYDVPLDTLVRIARYYNPTGMNPHDGLWRKLFILKINPLSHVLNKHNFEQIYKEIFIRHMLGNDIKEVADRIVGLANARKEKPSAAEIEQKNGIIHVKVPLSNGHAYVFKLTKDVDEREIEEIVEETKK